MISKQTTVIESQVTDDATGLPAVQASVLKLDGAVGDVIGDMNDLIDKVGELNDAVGRIEKDAETPGPSAHRLWVSPYWFENEVGGGSEAHIIAPAWITVLNPGTDTAHVSCLFFNAAGALLVDRAGGLTIGIGATRDCDSHAPDYAVGRGWMVVASDVPVLPYGFYYNGRNLDHTQREAIQFYPVDCDNPEGVEFVCMFETAP